MAKKPFLTRRGGGNLIIVRIHPEAGIQILTKERLIRNQKNERLMLYHETWETAAETMEQGDSILDAVIRAGVEELGHKNFASLMSSGEVILLDNERRRINHPKPEESFQACKPYLVVQQMKGDLCDKPSDMLILHFFVAIVPPNFEALPDPTGESGQSRWWSPQELLDEIKSQPETFFGHHTLAFQEVAQDIVDGKMIIE